ncbi:hypothetical protein QOT17_017759 [Balamuthia mandrillaris]
MTHRAAFGSDWETEVLDCCASPKCACLGGVCCGPCNIAVQRATLNHHRCGAMDLLSAIVCFPCCALSTRAAVREKYDIEGSCMVDAAQLLCCCCCSIAQQSRQMYSNHDLPAGLAMNK